VRKASGKFGGALTVVVLALAATAGGAAASERIESGPRTEPGCVEKLVAAPTLVAATIERAGSAKVGATGQTIDVAYRYPAVEGCDTLARNSMVRFQMRRGGRWTFPAGTGWIKLARGLSPANNAPIEPSFADHDSRLPARCEGGHRPRFRVQVRTQVKVIPSGRFASTGPAKDFPIAYAPPTSARC
jgi:hypothetical protein